MRNIFSAITLLLFFTACQSAPTLRAYQSPGPYSGGPLFKEGIYQQKIRIAPRNGSAREFRGVLRRHQGAKIEIIGLSPFATSVFRVSDDLTIDSGQEKIEIFEPALARFEDRLSAFYRSFRPLLAHRDPSTQKNLERYEDGRLRKINAADLEMEVMAYDPQGQAAEIEIRSQGWTAVITLEEFSPLKGKGP